MLLRAIITSRDAGTDELHEGDMFFVIDNCFHHHTNQILKCFVDDNGNAMKRETRLIYVSLDEDSLRQRRGCIRPGTSFDCVEHMTIVTKNDFVQTIPHCRRRHYAGTNIGNKLGDVVLPAYDTLWSLPCRLKNEIHGPFRVACGGVAADDERVGTGAKRKTLATVEPVFWRSRPTRFYESIVADYKISSIIDLTPGDGTAMTYCAKERIPYFGWALTATHASLLKQRVIQQVMESMFIAGDRLYQPELAKLLKTPGTATPPSGSNEGGGKQTEAKPATQGAMEDFKAKLEEFKRKNVGGTQPGEDSKRRKSKKEEQEEEGDSDE